MSENDKAVKYFQKCYELNPEHLSACFRLFLYSIRIKDYDKAFEYFDTLFNNENHFTENDNTLYLYLLNMVTNIPDRYKNLLNMLI